MKAKIIIWCKRLAGSFIQGFSHSAVAYLGSACATGLLGEAACPRMKWQSALAFCVVSGGFRFFGILEKAGAVLQGNPETDDEANAPAISKPPSTP